MGAGHRSAGRANKEVPLDVLQTRHGGISWRLQKPTWEATPLIFRVEK